MSRSSCAPVALALAAALVATAGALGCAANAKATASCAHVPHEFFGNEVPFAGDINCLTCCRNAGADNSNFVKDSCTCYGTADEPKTDPDPAPAGSGKWRPY